MKQILLLPILVALLFMSIPAQDEVPVGRSLNLKEFVGRYAYSTGFTGASYTILDDGRFEYNTWSDSSDPVWRESGTYTLKDDQIHFSIFRSTLNNYDLLDPKQANEAFRKLYGDEATNTKADEVITEYSLQVVKWDERIYLIEPGLLHLFAAAVNFGVEPRPSIINDNFLTRKCFLRVGDENKIVTGQPRLPESLRPYLQDSPIRATIKSLDSEDKENVFLINKGLGDGVNIGMSFVGEHVEPKYDNLLWVISVDEKSAKLKSFSLFHAYQYQLNNTLTTKIAKKE